MVIRERRERAGLSVDACAKRAGCSKALLSNIENGSGVENTGFRKVMSLCKVLGLDPHEIIDLSTVRNELRANVNNSRAIPLLNYEQVIFTRHSHGSVDNMPVITIQGDLADSLSQKGFALKIVGNDNFPEYKEGDQIVIDPDESPEPGEMVVAHIDGSDAGILRKYRPRGKDAGGEVIELLPLNNDHAAITIDMNNPGSIRGVVVKHIRNTRLG